MSTTRLKQAKVLVVGESKVGKSTLLHSFQNGRFSSGISSTNGAEFFRKKLDDKQLELLIWDMAGDKRFIYTTVSNFNNTQAALVCYDITNEHSFEQIDDYVKKIREKNSNNYVPIYLLGLKAHLAENRKVDESVAQAKAKKLNIEFFGEVSATRDAENEEKVKEFFNNVGDACLNVLSPEKSDVDNKPSIFARGWLATKSFFSRHWPVMVKGLVISLLISFAVLVLASLLLPAIAVIGLLPAIALTVLVAAISVAVPLIVVYCCKPKQTAPSLDEKDEGGFKTSTNKMVRDLGVENSTKDQSKEEDSVVILDDESEENKSNFDNKDSQYDEYSELISRHSHRNPACSII